MIDRQAEIFQSIIPLKTRVEGERFRRYQCQGSKAKQVYLNTLAVSAVNHYLNSLGWATSLEGSDSWNPILQTMMNVSDLMIPGYGKLECRYILEGSETVIIPPEVWSERIGYIIVNLDESLKYFTILGFLRRVTQHQVPLTELESLADFPAYLSQQKRVAPIQPTIINQWFSNPQDSHWQKLDELYAGNVALNFRSPQKLVDPIDCRSNSEINRVKSISLNECIALALILNIQAKSELEFDISLMVCNASDRHFLPKGLELIVLYRDSFPVMIAQTHETETIEFCFSGTLGERFSIEMTLDEQIMIESFII